MAVPAEAQAFPDEPTRDEWDSLIDLIKRDRCVPFLGAGAALYDSNGAPALPSAGDLARDLAALCQYPGSDDSDFLRVAQYYQLRNDPFKLRSFLSDRLQAPPVRASKVHNAIAELPFRYVLTTNFDTVMESTLGARGRTPTVKLYRPHGDGERISDLRVTMQHPLVYKLHGSVTDLASMIATEDEVVEFLACLMLQDPALPRPVQSLFETCSILFIGYGLKDWNIRVMLRALRGRVLTAGPPMMTHYAIQRRPAHPVMAKDWQLSVMIWREQEKLRCYDMDANDFAERLVAEYHARQGG